MRKWGKSEKSQTIPAIAELKYKIKKWRDRYETDQTELLDALLHQSTKVLN